MIYYGDKLDLSELSYLLHFRISDKADCTVNTLGMVYLKVKIVVSNVNRRIAIINCITIVKIVD